MSDANSVLEPVQRRVAMPEPALERLLRRRDRRDRIRRVAAIATGFGVAAAGFTAILVGAALRETQGTRPAGGPSVRPSPGGGAVAEFVMPTLAIWLGIAVLGLTAVAVIRLRPRPVSMARHEPRAGASPDPGHGPASGGHAHTSKGGTTMDSKMKLTPEAAAGISRIRVDGERIRRTNRWLTTAVVVLAAGLVALGTYVLIDRADEPGATPAPPESTVRLIDEFNAARNAGDGSAVAAMFAEDGYVRLADGRMVEGREDIERLIDSLGTLRFERVGDLIGRGSVAAAVIEYTGFGGGTFLESYAVADGKLDAVVNTATG